MLGDLKVKAQMTSEELNKIEGISCNEVMGAMYAFPRIHLPEKAIEKAKVGSNGSLYEIYTSRNTLVTIHIHLRALFTYA